jgi:hypothetical protein
MEFGKGSSELLDTKRAVGEYARKGDVLCNISLTLQFGVAEKRHEREASKYLLLLLWYFNTFFGYGHDNNLFGYSHILL